jgi:tetratricopeptide (TPR) repeat protein
MSADELGDLQGGSEASPGLAGARGDDLARRHVARGRHMAREGLIEEAERELRLAIHLAPDLADAHHAQAELHDQQGRTLEALRSYLRALELEPNHVGSLHSLAVCLRDRGLSTAGQLLQRAIEHTGENVQYYRALGELQRLCRNGAAAERAYLAWLDSHPRDVPMLRELALMYYEFNRSSEARHYFERVLALDADDHEAMNNLAVLDLEQSRWEEAERLLLRSAALAPWSFITQANLARLYVVRGRTDAALESLARAVFLDATEARALMREDTLLRSLRADPRWARLLDGGDEQAQGEGD